MAVLDGDLKFLFKIRNPTLVLNNKNNNNNNNNI